MWEKYFSNVLVVNAAENTIFTMAIQIDKCYNFKNLI